MFRVALPVKQAVVKLLAAVACRCGLVALFYWLNRRAKRTLTFHNVLRDDLFIPGVANGVSSKLSDFEFIIDECARKFRFSLDFDDPKTLTVTFDDGYRNQYTTAFASLKKRGISAYVFCSGECLGGRPLTIDLLTHWICGVPDGEYELRGHGGIALTRENRLEVWMRVLWPMFCGDAAGLGLNVLSACDAAYPVEKVLAALGDEYRDERLAGLSREQCAEMRAAGWRIGWHTGSHFPLSRLSEEDARREMTPPERDGMETVCFSYPYGEEASVGRREERIAASIGYPCAVSNVFESRRNAGNRYFIPRYELSPDRHLLHFELSGLKFFLRHFRLLPHGV